VLRVRKGYVLALFGFKPSFRFATGGFRVVNAGVGLPRVAAGLHKGLGKPGAMCLQ
jgi:hypothetical protein